MIRPLLLALAACLALLAGPGQAQSDAPKTLRYAFPIAETSFDPAQISDLYSRTVAAGIFDAPLEFAFLARPFKLRPNTAAAMPEVSADFRTFTFRLKPGILLRRRPGLRRQEARADRRRLRVLDQAPLRPALEERQPLPPRRRQDPRPERAAQARARREEALRLRHRGRGPARARPLHASQIRLAEPSPRFLYNLADGSFTGALAREVVEAYGDKIGEHPVGTGPYRLAQWKRSSRIVLREQPELPRGALRRAAAGRRRAAAGHCAAVQGPAPADDRPRARSRSSRSSSRAGCPS